MNLLNFYCFVLAFISFIMGCIGPRRLHSWMRLVYHHPDAHEPENAMFAFHRFMSFVATAVLINIGMMI